MSFHQGYKKSKKGKWRSTYKKNYDDWDDRSISSENDTYHGNDNWEPDPSFERGVRRDPKFSWDDYAFSDDLRNPNTSDVKNTFNQSPFEVKQKVDADNQKDHTSTNSDFSNVCKEVDAAYDALNNLSTDFLSSLQKNSFTDVSLKCGDYIQQVHKFVLAARSPVFEAMFSTPMEESENGVVNISDIDASVLDDMLAFIYGAQVKNITLSKACDLLYVAEKYQIKGLKDICTNFLRSSLSIPNAIQILQFADLYDEGLKKYVLNYVCQNFSALKTTEEWKTLQSQKPKLAIDVYSMVVEKYEEKIVSKDAKNSK